MAGVKEREMLMLVLAVVVHTVVVRRGEVLGAVSRQEKAAENFKNLKFSNSLQTSSASLTVAGLLVPLLGCLGLHGMDRELLEGW